MWTVVTNIQDQEWHHSYKSETYKSDDQTNIDKYGVAANIVEYKININLPIYQHYKIQDIKAIISYKKWM